MNDKERIEIMREGWEESIKALEKCRIFLNALLDNQWLYGHTSQIRWLLEDVDHAAKINERYFRPQIINSEDPEKDI